MVSASQELPGVHLHPHSWAHSHTISPVHNGACEVVFTPRDLGILVHPGNENITPGNRTDSYEEVGTPFYQACHVSGPFQSPYDVTRGEFLLRKF